MQILTAVLRTVIPSLWGSFISWLLILVPVLAPLESDLRGLAAVISALVTAVVIGAWYAFWRWLQPKLPDWLTRAVLGSAKTPIYAADGAVNPSLPTADAAARTATQSLDGVDGPDHRA